MVETSDSGKARRKELGRQAREERATQERFLQERATEVLRQLYKAGMPIAAAEFEKAMHQGPVEGGSEISNLLVRMSASCS